MVSSANYLFPSSASLGIFLFVCCGFFLFVSVSESCHLFFFDTIPNIIKKSKKGYQCFYYFYTKYTSNYCIFCVTTDELRISNFHCIQKIFGKAKPGVNLQSFKKSWYSAGTSPIISAKVKQQQQQSIQASKQHLIANFIFNVVGPILQVCRPQHQTFLRTFNDRFRYSFRLKWCFAIQFLCF